MKTTVLILFFGLLTSLASAQEVTQTRHDEVLQFVPTNMEAYSITLALTPSVKSPHPFLNATGWFLHGLKFRSAIDEFSALAPFDQRAFHPTSVRNYNLSLSRSYNLLNSHPSFYDR